MKAPASSPFLYFNVKVIENQWSTRNVPIFNDFSPFVTTTRKNGPAQIDSLTLLLSNSSEVKSQSLDKVLITVFGESFIWREEGIVVLCDTLQSQWLKITIKVSLLGCYGDEIFRNNFKHYVQFKVSRSSSSASPQAAKLVLHRQGSYCVQELRFLSAATQQE